MARQLVCDRCAASAPDTDSTRQAWAGVLLHKVMQPTIPIKDWDLCDVCSNALRNWLAVPAQEAP